MVTRDRRGGQDDGRGPECGTECARVSRWSPRARVRLRRWILAVVTVVVVAGGITIAVNHERRAIALWPTWHLIELEKGGGGWPTWATRILDTRLNAALAREAYPIERRHYYTDRALRKSEPPAWADTYQGGTIIDVGEFVLASGEGFVLRRHLVVQWDHPENHGGFLYNDDGILIDREFFAPDDALCAMAKVTAVTPQSCELLYQDCGYFLQPRPAQPPPPRIGWQLPTRAGPITLGIRCYGCEQPGLPPLGAPRTRRQLRPCPSHARGRRTSSHVQSDCKSADRSNTSSPRPAATSNGRRRARRPPHPGDGFRSQARQGAGP